jgi:RNA polymerase sigma-70 factor (ECF subfamily)
MVLAQQQSFDALARELSQPLLRYLRRCVGDQAVAEDLLQETLIRIARGLPEFAGRASVKTWAFSIATRVAADCRGRRSRGATGPGPRNR